MLQVFVISTFYLFFYIFAHQTAVFWSRTPQEVNHILLKGQTTVWWHWRASVGREPRSDPIRLELNRSEPWQPEYRISSMATRLKGNQALFTQFSSFFDHSKNNVRVKWEPSPAEMRTQKAYFWPIDWRKISELTNSGGVQMYLLFKRSIEDDTSYLDWMVFSTNTR